MFKAIIWDFDGTLFDTYPGMVWAFKKALLEKGIEEDDMDILKPMKISMTHAFDYFNDKYNLGDGFYNMYSKYEKLIPMEKVVPFSNIKEICSSFNKSGGKNFVLTHRGNSTFKYLEAHDMLNYFEEVVTKHNCFKRKPDPEGFKYFTDKYEIPPQDILGVGDRECDILGAQRAGMKTCLFSTNDIEINFPSDYKIKSPKELLKILEI